jgi:competence protein ComEA
MNKVIFFTLLAVFCLGFLMIRASDSAAQPADTGKINLNQASQSEFYQLRGMTEPLAKAIVEYRTKQGRFEKPDDLLKVPGMTKEYFDQISPKVTVIPEKDEITLPSRY